MRRAFLTLEYLLPGLGDPLVGNGGSLPLRRDPVEPFAGPGDSLIGKGGSSPLRKFLPSLGGGGLLVRIMGGMNCSGLGFCCFSCCSFLSRESFSSINLTLVRLPSRLLFS
ncbi:hypothetical protein B0H63DRAFT_477963 [Podospora didyma]|uniref:Uncharacterized protein n=1 Tax=Podospora didyma TaxID=330526 RepID=A0AAE0KJP5_9PEZI|nr:hypothetical protein B0H63DRAFT_477963 [Podospora didyma]